MKSTLLAGLVTGVIMVAPAANADLVRVHGEATRGTDTLFDGTALVDNLDIEFSASIPSLINLITFDFLNVGGANFLTIDVRAGFTGDSATINDLEVIFSDLVFAEGPSFVLAGLFSSDDLTGLTRSIVSDQLHLDFQDFFVDETRSVQFELTLRDRDDPTVPIPEPMSLTLLAMGLGGLAIRRMAA